MVFGTFKQAERTNIWGKGGIGNPLWEEAFEQNLRQAGFPKGTVVLSVPDPTTNVSLAAMNRPGYTMMNLANSGQHTLTAFLRENPKVEAVVIHIPGQNEQWESYQPEAALGDTIFEYKSVVVRRPTDRVEP
jgi:hypothetical protein